jgi:hypothetical protein
MALWGVWGYAEVLAVITSPDHEEHESMREWIGGSFDPEAFGVNEVNRMLGTIRYHNPR